mmetsp:Transcript_10559/g.22068  ORF Transcript_10559/g.22068 Transcript_10559/m.22068 type:complete len:246 (-) Transcript_10559:300-1037(-)
MEDSGAPSAKRDGLLKPGRVSQVYHTNLLKSTTGGGTIRIVAVASGCGLITSAISIWTHWAINGNFSMVQLLISLVSLLIGIFAIILESDGVYLQEAKRTILGKVPFLKSMAHRGKLYLIGGPTQFILYTMPLHVVIGIFTITLSYQMITIGRKSQSSLDKLYNSINDETALLKKFHQHDTNDDGVLEMLEFEGLISDLGVDLTTDELDAAFYSIDGNHDEKIAYDEFRSWWKECTAELRENSVV